MLGHSDHLIGFSLVSRTNRWTFNDFTGLKAVGQPFGHGSRRPRASDQACHVLMASDASFFFRRVRRNPSVWNCNLQNIGWKFKTQTGNFKLFVCVMKVERWKVYSRNHGYFGRWGTALLRPLGQCFRCPLDQPLGCWISKKFISSFHVQVQAVSH